jgi:hypothetical protein
MSFDIRQLEILDQGEFKVTNAAGAQQYDTEGRELSITLASPGTKKYLQAEHAYNQKQAARRTAMAMNRNTKSNYQDEIAEKAEFFAGITLSFNNFTYGDKTGYEMYKAFFSNPKLGFVAVGVDRYLGDWGNFNPSVPDNSPSM